MKTQLAPTGTLRAVINLGNAVLAATDTATGATVGVTVDLANELARRLGVPLALTPVPNAASSVAALTDKSVDVGFVAIDPARAETVKFTSPYVVIEGAYLVRDDSPLQNNDEVDAPGNRIATAKGSAYDLYLQRHIKRATIVQALSSREVVNTFLAQNLEVAASIKQQLQADAARVGGLRLLPGRFMAIEQAMGAPADRSDAVMHYLNDFIEEMKASGFVAAALKRHRIEGADVAPLRVAS